ncbi:7597_t:CDS:10 [Entrophospora sp. SA101]|nr:7597_t:CDS:10 [Entrophospora sp. SA101]
MVHLLNDYNTNLPHEISKRQIFSKLIICHIDESSIYDDSQSTINQVENLFEKYNCQFIGVKLEHIYLPDYTFSGSYNRDLEVINNNFDRSKQAKENSNNNINVMSLTSKGRGFTLPLEISAQEDSWFKGLVVSRPMKDMLSKEIGIYNHFLELDIIFTPTLTTMKTSSKASIDKLTEDFIVGLEKEYPSTVSTIVRTAAKLNTSNSIDPENHVDKSSFSSCCSNINTNNSSTDLNVVDINDLICYSCRVNLRDVNKSITLPPYITEEAEKNSRRNDLYKQIENFMLSEREIREVGRGGSLREVVEELKGKMRSEELIEREEKQLAKLEEERKKLEETKERWEKQVEYLQRAVADLGSEKEIIYQHFNYPESVYYFSSKECKVFEGKTLKEFAMKDNKGYKKLRTWESYYMPTWSISEVEDACNSLYYSRSINDAKEIYDFFKTCDLDKIINFIGDTDAPHNTSHMIMHMVVDPSNFSTIQTCEDESVAGGICGNLFEEFSHKMLKGGGKYEIKLLESEEGNPQRKKLELNSGASASLINELNLTVKGIFKFSKLEQITTEHQVNKLIKHLNELQNETKEAELYFAVPDEIYLTFNKQKFQTKQGNDAKRTPPIFTKLFEGNPKYKVLDVVSEMPFLSISEELLKCLKESLISELVVEVCTWNLGKDGKSSMSMENTNHSLETKLKVTTRL